MVMTSRPRPVLLALLLVLLVQLGLTHCLTLTQLGQSGDDSLGDGVGVGEDVKRDGRRITRGRYRMGYMFGKRSEMEDSTASALIKTLMRKAMSVDDLRNALQTDPAFADRVARHMDKNGDGYVSVRELL